MRLPSRIFFLFVCLLISAPAWAQSVAYVSTGPAGKIYSVDANSGATALLVDSSATGADYEGLVVLPDNVSGDNHAFLVYACDTAGGKIVRFDPAAASPITPEVFYSAGAIKHPQCGRGTFSGDLIVTDTGSGSGWYIFSGITNIALGSAGSQTPTLLKLATGSLEGTAIKNSGGLLIVDHAGNQVLKSLAPFNNQSPFISSGLSSPFGIARKSDGQIYVSNQANKSFIEHYDAIPVGGNPSDTCPSVSFGNNVPGMMQMAPDDTLYIAAAISATKGGLFTVKTSQTSPCPSAVQIRTSISVPPLVGVALALPNFTSASQTLSTSGGTGIVSFNYAAFQVNDAVGPCTLHLLARPTPPAFLGNVIAGLEVAGAPPGSLLPGTVGAVDLGWDGFETVVQNTTSIASPGPCLAADGGFHFLIATQVSQSLGSPQVVSCADDFSGCAVDTQGVFPLSQVLPFDTSWTGNKKTASTCQFFLTNSGSPSENEKGFFCGYQSPLTNTFDLANGTQDLPAASFKLGTAAVKFKLAQGTNGSACQNGPFITDAAALISLEQTATYDPQTKIFTPISPVPIQISSAGGSSPLEPIFTPGKQYNFNLNTNSCTQSSGVTGPCPFGTYAVTATFLSANTANTPGQSIYTVQTTQFKLIP